jgi:tellurite resistance protein TehA-like permease
MSSEADPHSRPAGRAAAAVRDLHPGYFAFVMATGIISTGTFLLGPSWLSQALLAATCAGLAVLGAALVMRLAFFRPSVAADIKAPTGSSDSSPSPRASTSWACGSRSPGTR